MEKSTSHFQLICLSTNHYKLQLSNAWNKSTLKEQTRQLNGLSLKKAIQLELDFSSVSALDSAAVIFLVGFSKRFQNVTLSNLNGYESMYHLYESYYVDNVHQPNQPVISLHELGKKAYEFYLNSLTFLFFMGKFFYFLTFTLFHPHKIRFSAILKQIEVSAIQALSIVALTSFLVGLVIAYQGAVQLEKFGANIFIVEMVCVTMFREIAPLVTAIVIAGRSASSFTAEIGAMKITDEVDAMKTMGFEPTMFLTLPRVLALIISLPLLVFFSDIIAVLAGMMVASLDLNITYSEFLVRMHNEVAVKHIIIGIFKSVFFGIAIAIIGCYRGFQVQNNTTSIGKYTTYSVVNAIFIVIILNAIFSVILTQAGI